MPPVLSPINQVDSGEGSRSSEVVVPLTVVTPNSSSSLSALVRDAEAAYRRADYAEARRLFGQVVAADPEGADAPGARFVSALAAEQLGKHEQAAADFSSFVLLYPGHVRTPEARVRGVRLWVFTQQWARASTLSRGADTATHSPREQIALLSAGALGALDVGELEKAELLIGKGRRIVDEHRLDGAGELPRDLAQLYYALGELRRRRGEQIVFQPFPSDFADHFERRAQLLLDAQSAYSDVMRAHDAHWTTMAGYRVGELYLRLHKEIMAMPRPPAASTLPDASLFEGAMRLRYSTLLKKGLHMFEHTLAMAERTGEDSEWVRRTREGRSRLAAAIKREEEVIAASPHSRQELRRVLDQIKARQ